MMAVVAWMKAQHNSPKQIYPFKLTVLLFHLYTAIASIYKLAINSDCPHWESRVASRIVECRPSSVSSLSVFHTFKKYPKKHVVAKSAPHSLVSCSLQNSKRFLLSPHKTTHPGAFLSIYCRQGSSGLEARSDQNLSQSQTETQRTWAQHLQGQLHILAYIGQTFQKLPVQGNLLSL